jgi:hypothetical protein
VDLKENISPSSRELYHQGFLPVAAVTDPHTGCSMLFSEKEVLFVSIQFNLVFLELQSAQECPTLHRTARHKYSLIGMTTDDISSKK